MKLHAVVRLTEGLPEHGLLRGTVGAVVAICDAPSRAYEVEFTDENGRTIVEVTLREEQIEEVPS
jgi:hypothetical protein